MDRWTTLTVGGGRETGGREEGKRRKGRRERGGGKAWGIAHHTASQALVRCGASVLDPGVLQRLVGCQPTLGLPYQQPLQYQTARIHCQVRINSFQTDVQCMICASTASFHIHLEPNTKPDVLALAYMWYTIRGRIGDRDKRSSNPCTHQPASKAVC